MSKQYSKDTLRKVQLTQLRILKEIHRVCKEEGIEYFVEGGTLLGAKRHGGFIPWDDDIDIGMTRQNYERFLKIADDKLPSELFVQNYHKEKNFPHLMSKVMLEGTEFVEYCTRKLDIKQGIFVDVFPYDNVSLKKRSRWYKRSCQLTHDLYWIKSMPDASFRDKPKNIREIIKFVIIRMLNFVLKIIPKDSFYSRAYALSTRYNSDESSEALSVVGRDKYYILKKDLFPLSQISFEGEIFNAPRNIEGYLTIVYGNWWELPPKELRVGHAPCKLKV